MLVSFVRSFSTTFSLHPIVPLAVELYTCAHLLHTHIFLEPKSSVIVSDITAPSTSCVSEYVNAYSKSCFGRKLPTICFLKTGQYVHITLIERY